MIAMVRHKSNMTRYPLCLHCSAIMPLYFNLVSGFNKLLLFLDMGCF